ncbi:MAG: YfhO family protein, partial [Ilumatobacteraceae bacterium]
YSGGEPLAGLPITGMLDPLHLPWLLLPSWLAPGFTKALQLLVAIGFTAGWCRRLGLSRRAGLVGGLAFATSGFVTYWTGWPQSNTAAVIPVVFFAAEGVLQKPSARRAAGLALAFGWLLAAGFPALALYTLMVLVPYVCVRLWCTYRSGPVRARVPVAWLRRMAVLAGGGALGVMLLAVQLQPLRDLVSFNLAERGGRAAKPSEPWRFLTGMVFPHLQGIPNWNEGTLVEPTSGQYYVGIVALALIAFGCTRRVSRLPRGVRTFLLAAAAYIYAVMFIGGPFLAVLRLVPFFDQNPAERMNSVACLLFAVLAAAGAEAWWQRDEGRWPWLRSVALGAGGLLVVGGVAVAVRRWNAIPGAALVTVLTLLALAGGGWWMLRGRSARPWLVRMGLPLLVAVEGFAFIAPNLPYIRHDQWFPESSSMSALASLQGTDRVDVERTAHPGVGAVYGLRTAAGHSFITGQWYDLLDAVQPSSSISLTFHRFNFFGEEASSPILDRLSVRYLLRPVGYLPGEAESIAVDVAVAEGGDSLLSSGNLPSLTISASVVGPFRGFYVTLPQPVAAGMRVSVTVDGEQQLSRPLDSDAGNTQFAVVVAAEDRGAAARTMVTLTVTGYVDFDADGVSAQVVRPVDDGQRLVHVADGAVWERLEALPRYRWASDAEVIEDSDDRVSWLATSQPADTVLLETAPSVQPSGEGSVVSIDEAEPEDRTIRTDSDGPGLLVIADAYRNGWVAFVDGVETPVVRADHALMAVEVPAGQHTIRLEYTPPGWPNAWRLSLLALLVVGLLWLWPLWARRRGTDEH